MKHRPVHTCEACGLHYINRSNHDVTCHGNPGRRGLQILCEHCGQTYVHDAENPHACPGKIAALKPIATKAPAVLIPRQHQSSPKEHWAEKEVSVAAQEIVDGKFKVGPNPDEFWDYGETQTVAEHPRVKDAMRRLETEMEEARNTQELLEKTAMYHELNARASQANQWDGQGRWIGIENEEMRKGECLTPQEFMRRLEKVIGPGRVQLNRFAVLKRVALLAPDPDWKPQPAIQRHDAQMEILRELEQRLGRSVNIADDLELIDSALTAAKIAAQATPDYLIGKKQVGTLQWPVGTEWMIMRFDDYGVPTTAKYLGWRTALLSLITLNIITEKEAHKAFPLGSGPAGSWYREQLQMLRVRGVLPA